MLGDQAAGTRGLMVGSVVMHLSQEELENVSTKFPIPKDACRAIIRLLTYDPIAASAYWDPIWQPLFRLDNGGFLLSPSLILGSSAERNLMTLLNRRDETRQQYNLVSVEKESEQLSKLESFFTGDRFITRRRIRLSRQDGTRLTDIDLLVLDRSEGSVLIAQAKWLIRPDYVTEVLAKDQEILDALEIMVETIDRVSELGVLWIAQVLGRNVGDRLCDVTALVINRDFLPSGWVKNERVPVVDTTFVSDFVRSREFTGLRSLYEAAGRFDDVLVAQHRSKPAYESMRVGDYTFELPVTEAAD